MSTRRLPPRPVQKQRKTQQQWKQEFIDSDINPIDTILAENEELQNEISRLFKYIGDIERESAGLALENQTLTTRMKQDDANLNALDEKLQQAVQKITILRNRNQELEAQNVSLHSLVEEFQQSTNLRSNQAEIRDALAKAELNNNREMEKHIQGLEEALTSSRQTVRTLRDEINELREKLEEAEERVNYLEFSRNDANNPNFDPYTDASDPYTKGYSNHNRKNSNSTRFNSNNNDDNNSTNANINDYNHVNRNDSTAFNSSRLGHHQMPFSSDGGLGNYVDNNNSRRYRERSVSSQIVDDDNYQEYQKRIQELKLENEKLSDKLKSAIAVARDSHIELESQKEAKADLIDLVQLLSTDTNDDYNYNNNRVNGSNNNNQIYAQNSDLLRHLSLKYNIDKTESLDNVNYQEDLQLSEWDGLLQQANKLFEQKEVSQQNLKKNVQTLQKRVLMSHGASANEKKEVVGKLQSLLHQGDVVESALLMAIDQLIVSDAELHQMKQYRHRVERQLNANMQKFGHAVNVIDDDERTFPTRGYSMLTSRVAHLESEAQRLKQENTKLHQEIKAYSRASGVVVF